MKMESLSFNTPVFPRIVIFAIAASFLISCDTGNVLDSYDYEPGNGTDESDLNEDREPLSDENYYIEKDIFSDDQTEESWPDNNFDNDTVNDEIQDEDSYVRPMDTAGWILLSSDRTNISTVISKAAAFGINEIHLSHDIIMDIDEIKDDEKAALIRDISIEAHNAGLKVWVWSHELANNSYAVCYDPGDLQWEQRRKIYRDALKKIPEIDGVVLMFGSSSPDPWYSQCLCPLNFSFCSDVDNKPVHIVKLLIDMVHRAVVEESGRSLIVRTFIHFPVEQGYVQQALAEGSHFDHTVMPKDVPQDWQPYHPHDSGFTASLTRNTVAEFDLAGEYWGQSKIPFALPDYLQYRLRYQHAMGSNGAFGRIERGSNSAFGTPNEVNIYAFSKLIKNVEYPVDKIWSEWVEQFYHLDPDSQSSKSIILALRRTFDIGRKMYYPKGFWMAKSSEIPDNADLGLTSNFEVKKISQWDSDYTQIYKELKNPSSQTIADIAQEKNEARYLADASLADLENAKNDLSVENYEDLKKRLSHLRDCIDVFDHVHQAIFRYQRAENENEAGFLKWNIDKLLDLAGFMEKTYGLDIYPCSPSAIRDFADSVKDRAASSGVPFEPMLLSDIHAEEVTATGAVIFWRSSLPSTGGVEYGVEIPDFGNSAAAQSAGTEHSTVLTGLLPGTRYMYRVRSVSNGTVSLSGDFSFTTTKY